MALTKIHYKIVDSWVHFCYVDDMYKDSIEKPMDKIRSWAYKDFGIENLETMKELTNLKETIRNSYREKYPELFRESSVDTQGWVRVWFTQHLKEELSGGE